VILGQEIACLIDDKLLAGVYNGPFDGSSLASGIYLYRLKVDNATINKFMTLIK